MIKLVDEKDYGELPLPKQMTRIELVPSLVKIVGEILTQLKPLIENKDLVPYYCFMVEAGYKPGLESILRFVERDLPPGCQIYETDGTRIFEIRGPSGGVTTAICFYLLAR